MIYSLVFCCLHALPIPQIGINVPIALQKFDTNQLMKIDNSSRQPSPSPHTALRIFEPAATVTPLNDRPSSTTWASTTTGIVSSETSISTYIPTSTIQSTSAIQSALEVEETITIMPTATGTLQPTPIFSNVISRPRSLLPPLFLMDLLRLKDDSSSMMQRMMLNQLKVFDELDSMLMERMVSAFRDLDDDFRWCERLIEQNSRETKPSFRLAGLEESESLPDLNSI